MTSFDCIHKALNNPSDHNVDILYQHFMITPKPTFVEFKMVIHDMIMGWDPHYSKEITSRGLSVVKLIQQILIKDKNDQLGQHFWFYLFNDVQKSMKNHFNTSLIDQICKNDPTNKIKDHINRVLVKGVLEE